MASSSAGWTDTWETEDDDPGGKVSEEPRDGQSPEPKSSADLIRVMQWLRADKHPQYALLPKSEYAKRRTKWGLP